VVESGDEEKALQHGKGAVRHLEELFVIGLRPFKRDLAHAVMVVLKRGTHAPKGTASDFCVQALVVDENRQMARQDRLDVARFLGSHGDAYVQTGGRSEHDGAPPPANMCETEPHVVFPPLVIVGIDALSIGIEYLQEHLIGEMIDRPVRRPLYVLRGGLACGK
jgi:hypothetical protein